MYLNRRDFFKKIFGVSSFLSLGVFIDDIFLNDHREKFICESFFSMGTYGRIQIFSDNLEKGKFLLNKAVSRIKQLDSFLTKFSPLSDIGRINNNPYEFNYISYDTFNVLSLGKYFSDATYGYFDMGLGNLLSFSGIDKFVPIVGNVTGINDMFDDLFIFSNYKVKLNRKNSMIDLGGIGKGFALDECVKVLTLGGIKHVAVEFGGDIRVYGGMPNSLPWRIFLDKRLYNLFDESDLYFNLYSGSLAISGRYLKESVFKEYHHIINPYSLKSNIDYLCLLMIGEECVFCDALSTACFNMSLELIDKFIYKFPNYKVKVYF